MEGSLTPTSLNSEPQSHRSTTRSESVHVQKKDNAMTESDIRRNARRNRTREPSMVDDISEVSAPPKISKKKKNKAKQSNVPESSTQAKKPISDESDLDQIDEKRIRSMFSDNDSTSVASDNMSFHSYSGLSRGK